jgi:hypothetical protein
MMKRILLTASVVAALFATPAFSADDAVQLTNGSGIPMKSIDVSGGKQSFQPILSNTSGVPLTMPTAGADAASNTALGLQIYNYGMLFNGTTWDRRRGDATNGAWINVKNMGVGVGADGWDLTQGTKADVVCATATGSCTVTALLKFIAQAAILGTATNGGTYPTASIGIGWKDGSGNIQPVSASTALPVVDTNSAALLAAAQAVASPFVLYAGASTNATIIKASAGVVYSAQLGSIGSVPAYVRFYDTATGPTCSSATGLVKALIIPAAATAANGGGSNVSVPVGVTFATGIGICVTGGFGSTDVTNAAAGAYIVNVDYR